jgi:hypothetical protein
MKNLLVVGGLGYLGSLVVDLCKSNSKSFFNVDVFDLGFFDNDDVVNEIRHDKIFKSFNEIDYINKYDYVIWSANVDVQNFYDLNEIYFNNVLKNLEFLCKKYKVINCSHWILSSKNKSNSEMEDFFLKAESIVESNNGINLRIPSLHGPSPRMRWDTEANLFIYSLMIQNSIMLDGNWLKRIPLANVYDMALQIQSICMLPDFNSIPNKTMFYCTEVYSLIELANLVRIFYGKNSENDIKVYGFEKDENEEDDVFETTPTSGLCLEKSINDIKKNMEKNMLPDFTSDKYNNSNVIQAMITGKNLFERMK